MKDNIQESEMKNGRIGWKYLAKLATEYISIQESLDARLVYDGEEKIQDTRNERQLEIVGDISLNIYPFVYSLGERLLSGKGMGINKSRIISLKNSSTPLEDLVQEGIEGVIRYIGKYDPEMAKINTFIRMTAASAMDEYAKKDYAVRLPINRVSDYLKKIEKRSKEDAINEIMPDLPKKCEGDMPPSEIAALIYATITSSINGDSPHKDGGFRHYSAKNQKSEEQTDRMPIKNQGSMIVKKVLKTLTSKEEKVMKMLNGLEPYEEHTCEEAGRRLTLTRERIRQIEAKARRKLMHPSRKRILEKLYYESLNQT